MHQQQTPLEPTAHELAVAAQQLQQLQLRQQPPAQHQTPSGAAATASAQLLHEEAWKVLLEHLTQWEAHAFYSTFWIPQHQFICQLLSCSKAMTSVVYRACSGELQVHMNLYGSISSTADDSEGAGCSTLLPQHESARRWLASHALLLQELTVSASQHDAEEVEAAVASGLRAAADLGPLEGHAAAAAPAGSPGSSSTARLHGWHFLRRRKPQEAQAQARLQQQPQHVDPSARSQLLLRRITIQLPSTGSLLCALAGCQHLTFLSISLKAFEPVAACQQALASLTALQELVLQLNDAKQDSRVLCELAWGLKALPQLHALTVRQGRLTQEGVDSLPAVLQRLVWDGDAQLMRLDEVQLDLSHLTALTRLEVPTVFAGDVLPPNLRELAVWGCHTLQPAAELARLESFSMVCIPDAQQCTQLSSTPTLREVRIGGGVGLQFGADPNAVASQLASLPLVDVELRFSRPLSPEFVASMQRWTKLTRLQLVSVHVDGSFKDLSQQLVRLPALRSLRLHDVTACRGEKWLYRELPEHERVADLQVFLGSCVRMPSLRSLSMHSMHLGRAVLELAAATQLEQISLAACHIDEETEERLHAKLVDTCELYISAY